MVSVVCGFIRNANPQQINVGNEHSFIGNKCLNNETKFLESAPFANDFFATTQAHYLLKKLLMTRMKFPLRINGKFLINVVFT